MNKKNILMGNLYSIISWWQPHPLVHNWLYIYLLSPQYTILHILLFFIFSLFFTYIYVYSLVLCYNILHCPLSGPDLTFHYMWQIKPWMLEFIINFENCIYLCGGILHENEELFLFHLSSHDTATIIPCLLGGCVVLVENVYYPLSLSLSFSGEQY